MESTSQCPMVYNNDTSRKRYLVCLATFKYLWLKYFSCMHQRAHVPHLKCVNNFNFDKVIVISHNRMRAHQNRSPSCPTEELAMSHVLAPVEIGP